MMRGDGTFGGEGMVLCGVCGVRGCVKLIK